MDWGTAAVNGMEERDRVDASPNLCSRPVARLKLTNCVILFSLLDPWLLLDGDISAIARLILLFYSIFLLDMWLLPAGDTSALARLTLTTYVLLFFLLDYGCYWPETPPSSPG